MKKTINDKSDFPHSLFCVQKDQKYLLHGGEGGFMGVVTNTKPLIGSKITQIWEFLL